MEIPRAFVCAESKIFDVSEWAICQVSVRKCVLVLHYSVHLVLNTFERWILQVDITLANYLF